jgi:modulator of FtsH protease HflC
MTMRNPYLWGILALVGLFLIGTSAFTVSQTQKALILRLGKPERVITEPGLQFKMPFIEDVTYFDNRILSLDMRQQEVLSTDQLRLVVDAFARFRIEDPLIAYQRVRSEDGARERLAGILESALRDELGKQRFAALLTPERGALMDLIQAKVNAEAKELGAKVVDVRIKRADLPAGNPLEAAFQRMRTAREQEARAIRADGIRQAEEIRAKADSEAARVYADAFNKDADFYSFFRSMQAYRASMTKGDTTVVMSPDSEFLRQFDGRR